MHTLRASTLASWVKLHLFQNDKHTVTVKQPNILYIIYSFMYNASTEKFYRHIHLYLQPNLALNSSTGKAVSISEAVCLPFCMTEFRVSLCTLCLCLWTFFFLMCYVATSLTTFQVRFEVKEGCIVCMTKLWWFCLFEITMIVFDWLPVEEL